MVMLETMDNEDMSVKLVVVFFLRYVRQTKERDHMINEKKNL